MTSENLNVGTTAQVQETSTPAPDVQISSTSVEDMIPKSKVNDLIHERTREAAQRSYEKGKAEALEQHRQSQVQPSSFGGMQVKSEAELRQMIADEFGKQANTYLQNTQQKQREAEAEKTATEIMSKIAAAKDRFPDLEGRLSELADFSELIPLVNSTDDAAGVIHDLLENPLKMAQLATLAGRSKQGALTQMQKLASSIKSNDAAKKIPHVNEPLSSISHSAIGMDGGSTSVESYRNQDWLWA